MKKALQNKGYANLELGKWKPGQSGNPGGRPKGFALTVRQETLDGKEPLAFLLSVMRGNIACRVETRVDAAKYLLDRGFGKIAPTVEGMEGQLNFHMMIMQFFSKMNTEGKNPYDIKEPLAIDGSTDDKGKKSGP